MENKWVRFNEDIHPLEKQCQISGKFGQCPFLIEEGGRYCPRHKGRGAYQDKQTASRNYNLTKFQARVEHFADSRGVKNLREEIGILRLTLEEVMNQCKDETDLVLQSQRISEIILRIEKLVTSCHKLEESTGYLIDKATLLRLAARMVTIMEEFVTDPEARAKISIALVREIEANNDDQFGENLPQ